MSDLFGTMQTIVNNECETTGVDVQRQHPTAEKELFEFNHCFGFTLRLAFGYSYHLLISHERIKQDYWVSLFSRFPSHFVWTDIGDKHLVSSRLDITNQLSM